MFKAYSNLPKLNQTYQTKTTKPNLPDQTYQTKLIKPNLSNLKKLNKQNLPTSQHIHKSNQKIKTMLININKDLVKSRKVKAFPELGAAQPQLVLILKSSNFGTVSPILKIQRARQVRIKFSVDLDAEKSRNRARNHVFSDF